MMILRACVLSLLVLPPACVMTFEEARVVGISSKPLAAPASSGSSSVIPLRRDDIRCAALSDQARMWNARTKTFTGLAGANGVALVPGIVPSAAERWKGILATSSAFFGVLAFVSNVQAESYGATWAKECS